MEEKKVDITVAGLGKLLNKSYESFAEERDLALERYRRQDEMIQTADDFVLQGKFNVDYLKIAADRSNAIFNIAKLVADIQYKDSGDKSPGGGAGVGDSNKSQILQLLKEMENEKPEPPKTE